MLLKDWRSSTGKTLRELAELLGLAGTNPSRSAQRIETGEALADAEIVERIHEFTNGAVKPDDMQAVRLAWLRSNRPEKFLPSERLISEVAA